MAQLFTSLKVDLCQDIKEFIHLADALMEHLLEEIALLKQIFSFSPSFLFVVVSGSDHHYFFEFILQLAIKWLQILAHYLVTGDNFLSFHQIPFGFSFRKGI